MQITATQTFLHDRDRYEEGEEYEVPPELGGYFVGNGWATPSDEGVAIKVGKVLEPQTVTLEIDESSQPQLTTEAAVKRSAPSKTSGSKQASTTAGTTSRASTTGEGGD